MNDRNSERERRVREMLKRNDKGRNPNEIGILSQGQAEIQGIQDELANELRMQQVQDSARLQTTGVMAQAAEGMLAMNQGNGPVLSQQVGNMNVGTQAIMKKYGVKPENSRKTTTQNIHTSSGGGTMNVRNEYTTNNHTDIKITQPQIPISQPQIPTVQKDPRVDNTAKFKTMNGTDEKMLYEEWGKESISGAHTDGSIVNYYEFLDDKRMEQAFHDWTRYYAGNETNFGWVLCHLICKADIHNLHRISKGFPEHVRVFAEKNIIAHIRKAIS